MTTCYRTHFNEQKNKKWGQLEGGKVGLGSAWEAEKGGGVMTAARIGLPVPSNNSSASQGNKVQS